MHLEIERTMSINTGKLQSMIMFVAEMSAEMSVAEMSVCFNTCIREITPRHPLQKGKRKIFAYL